MYDHYWVFFRKVHHMSLHITEHHVKDQIHMRQLCQKYDRHMWRKHQRKRRKNSSVESVRLVRVPALRWRYMIIKTVQRRAHILTVWEQHGLAATADAFSVSRATLYRWKKTVQDGHGRLEALSLKKRERYTTHPLADQGMAHCAANHASAYG